MPLIGEVNVNLKHRQHVRLGGEGKGVRLFDELTYFTK